LKPENSPIFRIAEKKKQVLEMTMDNKQASQKQRKFIFSRRWFPGLIVLIILATIGSLFYVINKPENSKPFSEFFLLDQNGKTANYPVTLTVGDQGHVIVTIVNHEGKGVSYAVQVKVDGQIKTELGPVILSDKAKWQSKVDFDAAETGDNQNVEFLLFENGETTTPVDTLKLWFSITK